MSTTNTGYAVKSCVFAHPSINWILQCEHGLALVWQLLSIWLVSEENQSRASACRQTLIVTEIPGCWCTSINYGYPRYSLGHCWLMMDEESVRGIEDWLVGYGGHSNANPPDLFPLVVLSWSWKLRVFVTVLMHCRLGARLYWDWPLSKAMICFAVQYHREKLYGYLMANVITMWQGLAYQLEQWFEREREMTGVVEGRGSTDFSWQDCIFKLSNICSYQHDQ